MATDIMFDFFICVFFLYFFLFVFFSVLLCLFTSICFIFPLKTSAILASQLVFLRSKNHLYKVQKQKAKNKHQYHH